MKIIKDIMKKISKRTAMIITILAIIIVAFALMRTLAGMKERPEVRTLEEQKRAVHVTEVKYSNIRSEVIGLGRLTSENEVALSSEVRGKIQAGDVPLKKGQSFKKNDLLLTIYDRETRLSLLATKSRFLKNIASILPDFKVDFAESYPEWQKFFNSIDIHKSLPPLPTAKTGKEKVFLASRDILSEFYSIQKEEELLKKYTIHAPFDGSYTSVLLEVGSIANPGSALAKMIRTDSLELEVPVELDDARWINIGDKVIVTTEKNSWEWEGMCVRKSDFVDPATQSIAVFIKVESSVKRPLYKGQYLKAIFPGANLTGVMELPRNAVFNHNHIFIVSGSRLKKRIIEIVKVNERTVIFRGIEEGSVVVAEPLINALENSLVEIIE